MRASFIARFLPGNGTCVGRGAHLRVTEARFQKETTMASRRNRLSLRIPWLIEAEVEGPFAIVVLLVLAILILTAKGIGWL